MNLARMKIGMNLKMCAGFFDCSSKMRSIQGKHFRGKKDQGQKPEHDITDENKGRFFFSKGEFVCKSLDFYIQESFFQTQSGKW